MSDYEEQETLDSLKASWGRWGHGVTWTLLIVLVALAAWNAWHYWQRRQTAQAALLYGQLQQALPAGDRRHMQRIVSDMEDKFGRTPYAQMSGLVAASGLYRAGDEAGARAQLQWVAAHATDDAYRHIATVRLAGLLLDEKQYDAGLKLLAGSPPAAFQSIFADRRGDLLAAQGRNDAARDAYRGALASLGAADASTRQLIQFKLDALGG